MSHIIVTGANGFVGRAVCRALLENGHSVTGLVRRAGGCIDGVSEWLHAEDDFAGLASAWPVGLNADCVIHLAARVHVMRDDAADPEKAFRSTNTEGTMRVAEAAQRRGATRIVYVSSIKAVAEKDGGRPLRETDPATPQDAYGRSKLATEEALLRFRTEKGLDAVIVRPPLVYGPGVRANFLSMMNALWRGVPLPLGAIDARRSLVYVRNLADALVHCAVDSRAANGCFHIADDEALTVSALLAQLARHLGKPARLLPVSPRILRLAGRMVGRAAEVERLTDSLTVDTSHIHATLGWRPPYTTDDGLAATARWYRSIH